MPAYEPPSWGVKRQQQAAREWEDFSYASPDDVLQVDAVRDARGELPSQFGQDMTRVAAGLASQREAEKRRKMNEAAIAARTTAPGGGQVYPARMPAEEPSEFRSALSGLEAGVRGIGSGIGRAAEGARDVFTSTYGLLAGGQNLAQSEQGVRSGGGQVGMGGMQAGLGATQAGLSALRLADAPVYDQNPVVSELTRPSNYIASIRALSFAPRAALPIRLGAEMVASGLGRGAAEEVYERTENPLLAGAAGIGAGVAGGIGAARLGTRWAAQGYPVGMSIREVGEEGAEGVARQAETARPVFEPPPTVARLYGAEAIEEGATRGRIERFLEAGQIRPDQPVASPALLVRAEARRNVQNQATRTAETVRAIIDEADFGMDDAGRIARLAGIDPTVPGAPTLRDVAARLPVYEPHLTDEQLAALYSIRDSLAPYRQALDEVAQAEAAITRKPSTLSPGSRPDVMEGGFYIPRGNAETEELADIATRRYKGAGGGRPGREGFEKTAVFTSEAEGIEAGYGYTPVSEAIGSYVRGIGNRTLDRHAANYFLSRVDEAGKPLAEAAADRVDSTLRETVEALRSRIAARSQTLRGQSAREGVLGAEAKRRVREAEQLRQLSLSAETRAILRKADLEEVEVWMPEIVRDSVPDAASLAQRADTLRARISRTPGGAISNSAENRLAIRQLGEVEALRDIRAAADQAGDDYGVMLDLINEAAERSARFTEIRSTASGRALLQNSRARVGRLRGGVRVQSSAFDAPPPFDGPLAAIKRYEDTLNDVLSGQSELLLARKPSTEAVIKAAEREMRVLERRARQAAASADAASGRAARVTGARQQTIEELDSLRSQLDQLKGRWEQAKSVAVQTPRDQGRIPLRGLEAYSFPWEIADEARRVLDAESPRTRGAAIGALNSLLRGVQATGEMSYLGIQGAISMASGNRAWRRAARAATEAWMNGGENSLGRSMRAFDRRAAEVGRPTLDEWAASGLRLGGGRTEFELGQSLGQTAKKVTGAERADRGFGTFGDVVRMELADMMAEESLAAGRRLDPTEMKTIAESVNRVTGWTPQRLGGNVGEALNFAPRYFAARLRALGQLGAKDVRQRQLARRLIGRYIALASTMTIAANYALGEETDFRPFSGSKGPTWNPLDAEYKNPNFMRIRNVGGRDWSLLGPVDATLGAVIGAGSLITNPTADPKESLSRLRAVFTAPLASAGLDWLVFGENFDREKLDNAEALGRDILDRIVPFAVPELIETGQEAVAEAGEGRAGEAVAETAAGIAQGFFGGRASRLTASERAKAGEFAALRGRDQFDAINAEAWRVASEQPSLRRMMGDAQTYGQWYQETFQQVYDAKIRAGKQPMTASYEAQSAVQQHPFYKAYNELRGIYRTGWVKQNPEEAIKFANEQAALPFDEQTWRPTREQRDIMEQYLAAKEGAR